jgi:uncharacterized RDD family membrane protein YckC
VRVSHRLGAKAIDLGIVFILAAVIPYQVGSVLGFLYSLMADALHLGKFRGQSLGKKVLKLRVVQMPEQTPCDLRHSLLRNSPVGIATFFGIIPVWGWIILGLLGLPLMMMEIYLMLSVHTGHRLGDVMGDTQVIYE